MLHGLHSLINLELAAVHGAYRLKRTGKALRFRNAHRSCTLTTQVGGLAPQIPSFLWAGSFLPSMLELRRQVDQAIDGLIMEADIGGVWLHEGIFKPQVSGLDQYINQPLQAYRSRPRWPAHDLWSSPWRRWNARCQLQVVCGSNVVSILVALTTQAFLI